MREEYIISFWTIFSNIGGNVGIWLGLSAFNVLDIVYSYLKECIIGRNGKQAEKERKRNTSVRKDVAGVTIGKKERSRSRHVFKQTDHYENDYRLASFISIDTDGPNKSAATESNGVGVQIADFTSEVCEITEIKIKKSRTEKSPIPSGFHSCVWDIFAGAN